MNKELLKSYQSMPCCICGTSYQVSAHHIKTKGAGGDDSEWNLIPICHSHHVGIHQLGLNQFINRYYRLRIILNKKGWKFDSYGNKWRYE